MKTIAIAGGTSPSLGKAIVTAIAGTSDNAVILSRHREGDNLPKSKYGAEIRYIDYTKAESMVNALRDVHTVISVIKIPGPEWATYQIALLHAAQQAGVKRFAPSEFECGEQADGRVDILGLKIVVRDACEEARKQGMECTRFCNSMFMNYLGQDFDFQGDEDHETRMLEGLDDMSIIWNLGAGEAEVPVKDDGTTPFVTMTKIGDVGRFVAAACELPDGKWLPSMPMVGETIQCSEITALVEKILGKKLVARTVDRRELERRVASIPGMGSSRKEMTDKMLAQIELLMLEDDSPGKSVLEPVLNRLCPEVQPTSVRDYLEELVKRQ